MATKTFGRRGLAPQAAQTRIYAVSTPTVADEKPRADAEDVDGGMLLIAHMPILTIGMIICLIMIFGVQQRLAFDKSPSGDLSLLSLTALGAAGYDLIVGAGQVWRAFMAPLLHGSMSHVLGNCFALFFVGMRLEPLIGRAWFAAIFALSALGGIIGSLVGHEHYLVTVGASGAITGLIGALFVVSFNHRAEEHDGAAMRRTALKFGVPALLPLAFGASGSTDYFAHLGGAIAGAVIAWTVCAIWSEKRFRPDYTGFAAGISMVCLTAALAGCVASAYGFAGYRAKAAVLIPLAQQNLRADDRESAALLARYPEDPMAHVIRGLYLGDHGRELAAEMELRKAMTLAGDDGQGRKTKEFARILLAIILAQEGRKSEGANLVADLCKAPHPNEATRTLRKAKLCP